MTNNMMQVLTLLQIVDQCTKHPGQLQVIQAWAMSELVALNAQMKEELMKPSGVSPSTDDEDTHVIDPNLGAERLPERRI